ncbi:MAG TPA: formate/nitrite transporter family protein [Candidatus Enterenecus stercoripullorum]|nr:formate/nitrite transporter family protein [Candidatus Enterenecus stercoripullorum]
MNYFKAFVSGILGGGCIALGGVAFLSLEHNILGALFFTVGLFTICTLGLNLFTGKVCYVFQQDRAYALKLPVIWLGNLTGTVIVGLLIQATRLSANLAARAQSVCQAKLSDGWLSLFLLGILCNIFIYIAVEGFNRNPHQIGKYLSLFFGVMVFILSGYEHCVADMFYFTVAGVWSVDVFLRLLVITLGNAVGGVIFPLIRGWLNQVKPEKDAVLR